ncbi:TonB-dependent receptor [Pseudidiomarina andamanensis]|uniref:TonB-dependent receptor n=1 Tax=Pseudidiomarina andamanensis TaxID=1940690 RepID=A0AA92ETF1_9GAMM|nr:TonB-dependent receptor [Pseudidiomarina andamanensis]MDS0219554.1 TonB-dependent receptor [Pseudidiomarina andamanensis]QGT95816.1 TonB-dependent receptor [Pseudidiomarina andamanensis]
MSQPIFRRSLLAMTIASVMAMPAYAQQEQANEDEMQGLERIEVTARRKTESLQEVPVSVSSFGAGDLEEIGVEDITELQQRIPNATIQVSRGTNSTLTAYIRGVGQQDPLWGFEPGVGVYIDDVYIARPQGAVLEVFDIERIEVLRGPQGTLYGKNTIGGALKYVTKELTGYNELSVQGAIGSYNQRDLKISGQTALSDNFFVGGAIASLQRDGFGTYLNTGDENYNKDLLTYRLSAKWLINENMDLKFSYDNTEDESNSKGAHRLLTSTVTGQEPLDNVYDSNTAMPVDNLVETEGWSLVYNWDINAEWGFKSVTAGREGYTNTNIDFNATGEPIFMVPAIYEDEQFTQEFQVNYSNNDNFDFVGGVYFYDGEACGVFGTVLPMYLAALGGVTVDNGGCVQTDSFAVFGQGNYQMTDDLTLTVGGRYTKDEKEADVFRYTYLGVHYVNTAPVDSFGDPFAVNSEFTTKADWSRFSPHVALNYKVSDDVMVYGSYSNGFKSGGVDMRGDQSLNPTINEPYDPEIVDTVEFGVKSELLDGRMRLNSAIFYSDYQDMQVTVQRVVPAGISSQVLNAGESTVKGFEVESVFAATDTLNFTAMLGYIDAEFDSVVYEEPATGETTDVTDAWSFQNTPELTYSIGFNQTFETEMGQIVWSANYAYRDDVQMFEAPSPLDQEGYGLLNTSVVWYSNGGNWTVGLHGKNLTDEEYRVGGYNFGPTFGDDAVVGYYGDPRTVSLAVGYKF